MQLLNQPLIVLLCSPAQSILLIFAKVMWLDEAMWTTPYSQDETREQPNVMIDASSALQETSPQKPAVAN